MGIRNLLNDGSFAVRVPASCACKWCGHYTENKGRKCDECLRDIEEQRRIDEARGK